MPDDSPYTTDGIGLLGTRLSEDLMDEIDTLFIKGQPHKATIGTTLFKDKIQQLRS